MSVRVKLPASLKHLTGNQTTLEITATNLMECLYSLVMRYPDLRSRLYNDKGEVHSFINIYINDEDMCFLNGLATPLRDGDEVIILPAIAGGEKT